MSNHKILYFAPGMEPVQKIVEGSITSKLQSLVGPTRSIECSRLAGTDYVIYSDMEAVQKQLPPNRIVMGRVIHGPMIVAKLTSINSVARIVGLTDAEQAALKDIILPVKSKSTAHWDIN